MASGERTIGYACTLQHTGKFSMCLAPFILHALMNAEELKAKNMFV